MLRIFCTDHNNAKQLLRMVSFDIFKFSILRNQFLENCWVEKKSYLKLYFQVISCATAKSGYFYFIFWSSCTNYWKDWPHPFFLTITCRVINNLCISLFFISLLFLSLSDFYSPNFIFYLSYYISFFISFSISFPLCNFFLSESLSVSFSLTPYLT